MLQFRAATVVLFQILTLLATWLEYHDCLIITSVLAGDKKFKTISFDTKLLKPLMFEKEMPSTEFRRHRTLRPPKFDIDVNIPIKLPLEDEYAKEEPNRPVTSDFFFQTDEIVEPAYPKKSKGYNSKTSYKNDLAYAASNQNDRPFIAAQSPRQSQDTGSNFRQPQQISQRLMAPAPTNAKPFIASPRSDEKESRQEPEQMMAAQESRQYQNKAYPQYPPNQEYTPDFIPGGYVNLQISGPTGGPKATYEDYDREKWAQQLSQAAGAMPYPILNYHQLQNFYGGLGTFTNGLAENRYAPMGILDKLKSVATHFSSKLHHLG